jgi:hypothetical protein
MKNSCGEKWDEVVWWFVALAFLVLTLGLNRNSSRIAEELAAIRAIVAAEHTAVSQPKPQPQTSEAK